MFQTTHLVSEYHTIIREGNDKGKSNGEYTTPQQIKSSTLQLEGNDRGKISGEYTTPQQIKYSSYTPIRNDRGKIVKSTQLPNKLNLASTLQLEGNDRGKSSGEYTTPQQIKSSPIRNDRGKSSGEYTTPLQIKSSTLQLEPTFIKYTLLSSYPSSNRVLNAYNCFEESQLASNGTASSYSSASLSFSEGLS